MDPQSSADVDDDALRDQPEEANQSMQPQLMGRASLDLDALSQPSMSMVPMVVGPHQPARPDPVLRQQPQLQDPEPDRGDHSNDLQGAMAEAVETFWDPPRQQPQLQDSEPDGGDHSNDLQGAMAVVLTTQQSCEDLLRGVSLQTLLAGFGVNLVASPTFSHEEAEMNYSLSREVDHVTEFISHPWASPGWKKWLALCLMFNMGPFIVVTVVCQFLVGCAYMLHLLPDLASQPVNPWSVSVAAPIAIIAALQGHRLPRPLRGSRGHAVFFDGLCINQGDSSRKLRATRAIAAIVARSDRLLLLWDTVFFERLWCVLEVAAIVFKHEQQVAHGKKRESPVIFLPLFMTDAACRCFLANWIIATVVLFSINIGRVLYMAVGVFMFCTAKRFVACHDVLKKQLEGFSVAKASCSVTEDRQILLDTIVQWFGSLENFETHMKTVVLRHVLDTCRAGPALPGRWVALAFVPLLLGNSDHFLYRWRNTEFRHFPFELVLLNMAFALLFILVVRWYIFAANLTYSAGQRLPQRCNAVLDVVVGVFTTLSSFSVMAVVAWVFLATQTNVLVGIAVFCLLLLLVICTSFQWRLPRQQGRHDRDSQPNSVHTLHAQS